MRIFCWNVNSLVPTVRNINLKYGSLAKFFQYFDADIVCLQEVKLPYAKLTKDLVVVEGYQSYWSCSEGKTGYSGVTTWARHECAAVSAEADPLNCEGCAKEGRCLVTDHGSVVLFNVYVPNAGDRPERARLPAKVAFLSALKEKIDVLVGSGRQVIAVGDFNVASEQRDVHSAITWETLYEQQELDALHALFDSCTDTWRYLHPADEGVYTVWSEKTSARAFNVGLRIDYAICSKGLQPRIKSCDILLDLPPKWSDHAPVLLELDLPGAVALTPVSQTPQQQGTCTMWQQLLKQFADPSQRSIASMFRAASTSRHQEGPSSADHSSRSATAWIGQPAAETEAATQAARTAGTPAIPEGEQARRGSPPGSKRSCQQLNGPLGTPAADPAAKQARIQAACHVAGQPYAALDGADPCHYTDEQSDVPAAAQLQGMQQRTIVAGSSKQGMPAGSTKPASRRDMSSRAASKQMQKGEDNSKGPRQAKLKSFFTAAARSG